MIRKLIPHYFIFSFLFLLAVFFVIAPSKTFATCNGICEGYEDYAPLSVGGNDCPTDCQASDPCLISNCSSPQPSNVCCRPGVTCPGGYPTWNYAHDATCKVDQSDQFNTQCSWYWQYDNCRAADRCAPCSDGSGNYKVCAGECNDSGCTTGGWYKSCCNSDGSWGSCSGGGCSQGTITTAGVTACTAGATPPPGATAAPQPTSPPSEPTGTSCTSDKPKALGVASGNCSGVNKSISVTISRKNDCSIGCCNASNRNFRVCVLRNGSNADSNCDAQTANVRYFTEVGHQGCASSGDMTYNHTIPGSAFAAGDTVDICVKDGSCRNSSGYLDYSDWVCQKAIAISACTPTSVPTAVPTTPPDQCQTSEWVQSCGWAGYNWCNLNMTCDSGWITSPQRYVSCPEFQKFKNTGTYCTRPDGTKKFNGTTSDCYNDPSCGPTPTGSISNCYNACGNGVNGKMGRCGDSSSYVYNKCSHIRCDGSSNNNYCVKRTDVYTWSSPIATECDASNLACLCHTCTEQYCGTSSTCDGNCACNTSTVTQVPTSPPGNTPVPTTPPVIPPTNTPTPLPEPLPNLGCSVSGGNISWSWSDPDNDPPYELQVSTSDQLNASHAFVNPNILKQPGITTTSYNTNALAIGTYFGRVVNGNVDWSNTKACIVKDSRCEAPYSCLYQTSCPAGSPQMDCSANSRCCIDTSACTPVNTYVSCLDETTGLYVDNLAVAAGQTITCTSSTCPNTCYWTTNPNRDDASTPDVVTNKYTDFTHAHMTLPAIGWDPVKKERIYPTISTWGQEIERFISIACGKVDKVIIKLIWDNDAAGDTVWLKLSQIDGSGNVIDIENSEEASFVTKGGDSCCNNCATNCPERDNKICSTDCNDYYYETVEFDLGKYSLLEPNLVKGNSYIIQVARNGSKAGDIWWPLSSDYDYWEANGEYRNFYEIVQRDPASSDGTTANYGTFNPEYGSTTQYTVPDDAQEGQTWLLTSRALDDCGWGWGNDVALSIGVGVPTPTLTPTQAATPTPTETPTPTLTPTPVQTAWVKLKNTSFQTDKSLDNDIPSSPLAYDADDTVSLYFIDGESGSVIVNGAVSVDSNNPYAKVSSGGWVYDGYNGPNQLLNKDVYLEYIKSRKEYTPISFGELATKSQSGIYYINTDINFTNSNQLPNSDFVLIVDGTVSINIAEFNVNADQPNHSVAILANNIVFGNNTTKAYGIFVANSLNTGTNTVGLKFKGNVIASSLINNRTQPASTNRRPSLFVVFHPETYFDLLPYLSVDKYDWQQIK